MQNKWERVSISHGEAEKLYSKARTFAGDVWFHFRHKPTALIGLILALMMILFAVVGPFLTPYDYSEQETKMANIPPVMTVYPGPNDCYFYITESLKVIEVDADGHLVRQLRKKKDDSEAKQTSFKYEDDQLVYLDYTQKPYTMLDENGARIEKGVKMWNKTYLLGTDHPGGRRQDQPKGHRLL